MHCNQQHRIWEKKARRVEERRGKREEEKGEGRQRERDILIIVAMYHRSSGVNIHRKSSCTPAWTSIAATGQRFSTREPRATTSFMPIAPLEGVKRTTARTYMRKSVTTRKKASPWSIQQRGRYWSVVIDR
jgi:hypothetical protein